eukprot:gene13065-8273_t
MNNLFDLSDEEDKEEKPNDKKIERLRNMIMFLGRHDLLVEHNQIFQNDQQVLCKAIGFNQKYIKYASSKLQKNKSFLMNCIDNFYPRINGFNIEILKDYLSEKDLIKKLALVSPQSFEKTEMLPIWKDEDFLIDCLKLQPDLICYLEIKKESLLIVALKEKPDNLKYCKVLSKESFSELLQECEFEIKPEFIPNEYFKDLNFMELFLDKRIIYGSVDLKFQDSILEDKRMVKLILKKLPLYLSKLNEKQKNEKELIEIAVLSNPVSLIYASNEMRDDRDLVLLALEKSKKPKAFIESISNRLKNDGMVMIEAVKKTAYCFIFASDELQFDLKFVIDSLDYNRDVLEFIDISFRKDVDIQMILEGMYYKLRIKNEVIANLSDLRFLFK